MVFQKLKGKLSLTQANFLKTQAKFCQNSSKILKNSIYRKFHLRALPPKLRKNKPELQVMDRGSTYIFMHQKLVSKPLELVKNFVVILNIFVACTNNNEGKIQNNISFQFLMHF